MFTPGIYHIRSHATGAFLASTPTNGIFVQGICAGSQPNQKWNIQPAEQNLKWTIQCLADNQYLTPSGRANDSPLNLTKHLYGWEITELGGLFRIPGTKFVVDHSWDSDDLSKVIMFTFNKNMNQQWSIEPVGDPNTATGQIPQYASKESKSQESSREPSRFSVSAGTYCIRKVENGEQVDISFGKQALADEGILGTANAQLMEWDVRVTNDGYKLHVGPESHLVVELSLSNKEGATMCLFPENSSTSMFRLVL